MPFCVFTTYDEVRCFDRFERAEGFGDEVRRPGGIEHADAGAQPIEARNRGSNRVLVLLFDRVEVAYRRSTLDAARRGDGTGFREQAFDQGGLSRASRINEGDRS
jgi:hypothetical protein